MRLGLVLPVLAVAGVSAALAASAQAARPPAPAGMHVLAAGQTPGYCPAGQGGAYDTTTGTYYSTTAKQWLSAPWCYPRWGNLMASPSQIGRAGGKVTVAAIPTDGSNSAEYAPQTGSIAWTYPGKRVSGCGNADLTCTVIAAKKGTAEWQWGEFHVSMPRTFLIDSPGSNCAGQHLCAGVTTQAWSWVGIPPKGKEPRVLAGKVVLRCGDGACSRTERPIANVRLRISGPKKATAKTDVDGAFEETLPKGKYTVTPSVPGFTFTPRSRTVSLDGGSRKDVDFDGCTQGASGSRRASPRAAGPVTLQNRVDEGCRNRVTVTYAKGAPTMAMTWRVLPECNPGSGHWTIDGIVPQYNLFTRETLPVAVRDDGVFGAVLQEAGVADPFFRVGLRPDLRLGAVELRNTFPLSPRVVKTFRNTLTAIGETMTCRPIAETLTLHPR